jgi:adenylate kinase family enzyme
VVPKRLLSAPKRTSALLIIVISGTGKSTLARLLTEKLNIPVYHMDRLIWKENWEEVPQEGFREAYDEILHREKWIIEG